MISLLNKLLGRNPVDLAELIKSGAVIIDVRSKEEFHSGHVKGSFNIPLDQVSSAVGVLKKHKHIIVCCRSGNRSGMAKQILRTKGVVNVTNGGSWQNVNKHIKK